MNRTKRLKYILLAALLTVTFNHELRAALDYGMTFKSYEVSPKERTSLTIPATGDNPLYFTDSLEVSFAMILNLNIGKFGYICSVITGEDQTLDVLLHTSADGTSTICATGKHEHIIRIPLEKNQWQNISLGIRREGDSLALSINGRKISKTSTEPGPIPARINFGRNIIRNFETDDVAPMVVKDLCIRTDRNNPACWKLTGDKSDTDRFISLETGNPLWLKRLNSQWTLARTIPSPSVAYICTDSANGLIYIISEKAVSRYDVCSMTLSQWQTSNDIRTDLTTNDFIILQDGTLAYLDIDSGSIIRFNHVSHDWERSNPRTRRSIYLHDNLLYDSEHNRYLQLFGYGQHRYQKNIKAWDPADGSISQYEIEGLTPRYMAASTIRDGKIYVYSGKGNTQGAQEFGAYIYNDLVEINLDAMSAKTLWENKTEEDEVAASDLIAESNRNSFLALTFNPKAYNTSLQLKRIGLDGSITPLAQSIPFNFLDIESEAKLMYCDKTASYHAVVSQKNNDGQFAVSIYTILAPPCAEIIESQESDLESSPFTLAEWALVLVILIASAAGAIRWKARRQKAQNAHQDVPVQAQKREQPGIYLLGGFKITGKSGEDLSGNFSPLMKQLLSIIILNSDNLTGGISNAKLKDALWYDKSDNSYNNNRGVTLTKIRTYLQEVDESLVITSNNGHWYIDDPNGVCDYTKAMHILGNKSCSLDEMLNVASWGSLLPDVRIDWLDSYKTAYDNLILGRLRKGLESVKGPDQEQRKIQIADAILIFDTLDEESVRLKCQCLIALKHAGAAKRAFDQFCSNYHLTLDEEFSENFTDFIKNQTH